MTAPVDGFGSRGKNRAAISIEGIMKTNLSGAVFVWAWAFLASAFIFLLTGCATGVRDTSRSFRTVVIDAGHGGHDSGASSRRGGREKNATLEVAQRLEEKLRTAGFHTVMTREGDYFVPLDRRAAVSNRQRNAIFVSIHFNDSPRRRIRGVETYYNSPHALPLADKIQQSLTALSMDRGVRPARFRVLRKNRYPAVLVECGFLSNPREASRCATSAYREALAERIAGAIVMQRRGASPEQTRLAATRGDGESSGRANGGGGMAASVQAP